MEERTWSKEQETKPAVASSADVVVVVVIDLSFRSDGRTDGRRCCTVPVASPAEKRKIPSFTRTYVYTSTVRKRGGRGREETTLLLVYV